jgi:hypothetical protein
VDVVVTCSEEDAGRGRYFGKERDAKLLEYWNTPSIMQFVVIETDVRETESYCRDADGIWQPPISASRDEALTFPSFALELTLDEIYRRTTFAA